MSEKQHEESTQNILEHFFKMNPSAHYVDI